MDGRVVLIIAHRSPPEPRFQVSETLETQQVFGADVEGARTVTIDGLSLGYPRESLDGIPAGEYFVQAVLNVYETFHRADGHTLKLPMDQGEGQHWYRRAGKSLQRAGSRQDRPGIERADPHRAYESDTGDRAAEGHEIRQAREDRKQAAERVLGRPMYLGAVVVTPEGFDEHPEVHYPVLYSQGHFAATFTTFRTSPAAATSPRRSPLIAFTRRGAAGNCRAC